MELGKTLELVPITPQDLYHNDSGDPASPFLVVSF